MNHAFRFGTCAALLAILVTGTAPFAGEDHDAEMAKWMEVAAPGPHHAHMKDMVGTWKATGKMWMKPGEPPAETTGTAEFRLVLGGRFLDQRFSGMSMGMPFEGIGISGFDNLSGKHTSFWIDTWGTLMTTSEGSCTDHCSVITETGHYPDIMTGGTKTYKMVVRSVSKDEAVMEMYDVAADGTETRTMEMVYTRAGS
ncbi:MAG: DUF1579 domain-containing protein [Candidatus Eisenbacteria bacterium]